MKYSKDELDQAAREDAKAAALHTQWHERERAKLDFAVAEQVAAMLAVTQLM